MSAEKHIHTVLGRRTVLVFREESEGDLLEGKVGEVEVFVGISDVILSVSASGEIRFMLLVLLMLKLSRIWLRFCPVSLVLRNLLIPKMFLFGSGKNKGFFKLFTWTEVGAECRVKSLEF